MSLLSSYSSLDSWWSQANSAHSGSYVVPLESQDENNVGAALSQFLLESASRQLRLFNLSSLAEETVSLNLGEGVDYSVDLTKSDNGGHVVVKHFKKPAFIMSSQASSQSLECMKIRKAVRELQIMTYPDIRNHQNIIGLNGYAWEQQERKTTTPCLVIEYAQGGNMRQFLKQQAMTVEDQMNLNVDVARGIEVLHSHSIYHGDVKMENILICRGIHDRYVAKIADFGSSVLQTSHRFMKYYGTPEYQAPEIRQSGYDPADGYPVAVEEIPALDIYSFGLLLVEVALCGMRYVDSEIKDLACRRHFQMIGEVALKKINGTQLGRSAEGPRFLSATKLALSTDPSDRKRIAPILALLLGKSFTRSDDGPKANLQLHEEPGELLLDMSDPLSLFAVFRGRGATGSRLQMLPWSVMTEIASRYRVLVNNDDKRLAAFCHMCMSVCYYNGFGTERNKAEACAHMKEAALLGSAEAHTVLHQLCMACDQIPPEIPVQPFMEDSQKEELDILQRAVSRKRTSVPFHDLSRLLKKPKGIDKSNMDLHVAAALGNYNIVKKQLQTNEKDVPNGDGQSAILLACLGGHLEIVKLLLEHGSDASLPDQNGLTPLHMLIMFAEDDVPLAARLIRESLDSVDVNAVSTKPLKLPGYWDELIGTPLCWAVTACNESVVNTLLSVGASLEPCAPSLSPLYLASSLHLYWILEILMQSEQCTESIINTQNPLFYLNESHPYRLVQIHGDEISSAASATVRVLKRYWDVNSRNEGGWSPLVKVAMTNLSFNDIHLARALAVDTLKTVEDPKFSTVIAGIMGCNACHLPSHAELTISLIEAGFDPLATSSAEGDWPGYNAMHWAAATGNSAVIDALVKRDPSILDTVTQAEQAETPLHIAAGAPYGLATVRQLLDHGANALHESGYKLTPLAMVISGSRSDIDSELFQVLLRANAKNGYVVQDNMGLCNSIFHLVVLHEAKLSLHGIPNPGLLRYLLADPGAKTILDQPNSEGLTPFHIACLWVGYGAIRSLVEAGSDCFRKTPQGLSGLGLVLEIANRPELGIGGVDLTEQWYKAAYKAAIYLSDRANGTTHDKKFSLLHLATYVGYVDEVERLVRDVPQMVEVKDAKGLTAQSLLYTLLFRIQQDQLPVSEGYVLRLGQILDCLDRATKS